MVSTTVRVSSSSSRTEASTRSRRQPFRPRCLPRPATRAAFMDAQIFLVLLEDGIANGAIHALLALTMVLVFTTTRILFVPQGEFVTFAALTFASLQIGLVPQIVWLLGTLALAGACADIYGAVRLSNARRIPAI